MIKIIFLISTLKKSGPVLVLFNIVKHLNKELITPIIVTLSPEPENSIIQDFQNLDIEINCLNLSRIKGVVLAKYRVEKLCKKHCPDIVHSHGFRADSILASIKYETKKVSTIHNNPFIDYPMKFGAVKGKLMAQKSKRNFQRICIPVSCSKSIQSELNTKGLDSMCIQNGIDVSNFDSINTRDKIELRKKLELPTERIIAVVSGSLIHRKNVAIILRGVAMSKREDALILILGSGPEEISLRSISNSDDRIRFLGFRDNVSDYLKAGDCIISASLSEGLPNGILEAMSCGLHCILSDIPAHRELNLPEGNNYFRANQEIELSLILDNLDKETINTIGAKNHKIATTFFSSRKMSEDYQTMYLNNVKKV